MLVGFPSGLELSKIFGNYIPVPGDVGADTGTEVSAGGLPTYSKLKTAVEHAVKVFLGGGFGADG